MIAFAFLIAVVVVLVVPLAVWWAVTQVVPRVLGELGLSQGMKTLQEARLRRIEEAIEAIALQVDRIERQQVLQSREPGRTAIPPEAPRGG